MDVLTWGTNSTKQNGIVLFQSGNSILGHVPASFEVSFARPVEVCEVETEGTIAVGELVENFFGGLCDIDAIAVTRDSGNLVRCRHDVLSNAVRLLYYIGHSIGGSIELKSMRVAKVVAFTSHTCEDM